MSLSLDVEAWPKRPGHARRSLPETTRATVAVVTAGTCSTDEFEDAVAELVEGGYGRELARCVIATRMKYPEHEIARLREAAR
jgi:hypothetical protein